MLSSSRRSPLHLTAAIALLVLSPAAAFAEPTRSVVIVVLDSLRADHVQPYGYGRATTPNILAFSRGATTFLQAYPAASWTRPSILSLLTGRYPSELTTNPSGAAPLKIGQPTLATVMKAWGYTTAAFHNTAQLTPPLANIQPDFQTFVDYGESGDRGAQPFVSRGVDQAIDFLRAVRKPVFLFLHVLDPHHPYYPAKNLFGDTPTNRYSDSYSFATGIAPYDPDRIVPCFMAKDLRNVPEMMELYDSEIRELDAEVGRLLRFIDGDRRYRDALVIITSDHGEEFGEHGGLFHGARFYEESLRVPLIVRDPARPYSAGRRVSSVVSQVDVAPTILSAVGISHETRDYSGRSLLPFFGRREAPPRDTAIIERYGCGYDPVVAVRKGDWKMIIRLTRPRIELYNLRDDPGEKRDLGGTKSPAARRAHADLYDTFEKWYRRVNRPLATRNGDDAPPIPDELRKRLKALGYLQ